MPKEIIMERLIMLKRKIEDLEYAEYNDTDKRIDFLLEIYLEIDNIIRNINKEGMVEFKNKEQSK